jgi:hypothetical protein
MRIIIIWVSNPEESYFRVTHPDNYEYRLDILSHLKEEACRKEFF